MLRVRSWSPQTWPGWQWASQLIQLGEGVCFSVYPRAGHRLWLLGQPLDEGAAQEHHHACLPITSQVSINPVTPVNVTRGFLAKTSQGAELRAGVTEAQCTAGRSQGKCKPC